MILMHVAYGLDLIALAMGTALLVWAMKNPGKGSWMAKLFGAIIMVLSIISMVCIYSCALRGGECHKPLSGEEMTAIGAAPADAHGAKKVERKKN